MALRSQQTFSNILFFNFSASLFVLNATSAKLEVETRLVHRCIFGIYGFVVSRSWTFLYQFHVAFHIVPNTDALEASRLYF